MELRTADVNIKKVVRFTLSFEGKGYFSENKHKDGINERLNTCSVFYMLYALAKSRCIFVLVFLVSAARTKKFPMHLCFPQRNGQSAA